ncbi:MAG: restriction endonuclease subunit S [Spirochaetaceae bacterium]|nr:restriction endonuclease subunit S [Spirochaetaceae bacterium]
MGKIKKDTSLRKSILQASITGQLVSDVERETETGKQLLDRIIEERNKKLLAEWEEKLKENPKAKKPTQIVASEIAEDEIPFEIPENWCWCRLGEICYKIGDIDHKMPKEVVDGIPYISPRDFTETDIDFINAKKISQEDFNDLSKKMKPKRGDIIFPRYGTIGTVRLVNVDFNFLVSYSCCTISSMRTFVSEIFIFYALQSKHIKDEIEKYINKTTQPNVGLESIKQFLFPLPPLAVQNAIVAKLEEVLPLVDAYENVVLQKEELKNALPDKVKKAILQEAIQGKLTEDWRKTATIEETGKQLLDRIIEERNTKLLAEWEEAKKKNPKAKKPTLIVASEIDEEEIPFEVPDSWCWCRLGDVGDWKAGSTPSRSNPKFYNGNIPWLKTGDLTDDFVDVIPECISEIALESCSIRLNPVGSVLIAMYGATIGKLGILNIEATTNQACCACITHEPISNKYLFYYLMSQKKALTEKAEGGAQPNISREKLVIHPFPLPPLAEQKKIVEILEQMLLLCEKLGG